MRRDRGRKPRRKVCVFCADHIDQIDYKDVAKLRRFTTERGKILPRRISGTCAKHQRKLTTSIKRARAIALLPFTAESLMNQGGTTIWLCRLFAFMDRDYAFGA